MGVEIYVVVLGFVTIFVSYLLQNWWNPKYNGGGILPPGSMGIPLIGETLHLLSSGHSLDTHPFLSMRFKMYGPIFKTNLVGQPIVISSDAEFNHTLFLQEGKSVELWYMDSFSKLFNVGTNESSISKLGAVHKYIRSIVLNYFGPEPLKREMLAQIETTVDNSLQSWSTQKSIEVKHAVCSMVFDFTAKRMFGYDPEKSSENIEILADLVKGLISFPINIPGTVFHKCMKVQKMITNMIKEKIKEKRSNISTKHEGDLLDQAVKDMETELFLTEDLLVPLVFGITFASFESISSSLTLAFKLLSENPDVIQELIAEHDRVLKNRGDESGSTITWEEYKSMTFTNHVVLEVIRMTSVAPGILRRALKDIQVHGYTIPAGWTIMVASSAQMLNPNTFNDPLQFNPWRWKDLDSNVVSKNFIAFGGGMRQCAGAEFGKAFMATFLHVLITKYRWTKISGGEIGRTPFLDFGKGIHIKVEKRN